MDKGAVHRPNGSGCLYLRCLRYGRAPAERSGRSTLYVTKRSVGEPAEGSLVNETSDFKHLLLSAVRLWACTLDVAYSHTPVHLSDVWG